MGRAEVDQVEVFLPGMEPQRRMPKRTKHWIDAVLEREIVSSECAPVQQSSKTIDAAQLL